MSENIRRYGFFIIVLSLVIAVYKLVSTSYVIHYFLGLGAVFQLLENSFEGCFKPSHPILQIPQALALLLILFCSCQHFVHHRSL